MGVEGIWKIEMLGPYGWEAVSTAFLEKGRYHAGSQDHYAIGKYEVDGDQVQVKATMNSHGKVRTMFGASKKTVELNFSGELKDDRISGQAEDKKAKYSVTFRATKLRDLG